MYDLIILYFLLKRIGRLAISKNIKPLPWKIYTVIAWFVAENIGIAIAMGWLGIKQISTLKEAFDIVTQHPGIIYFGLFSAFGGYLFIKYLLERKKNIIE